MHLTTGSPGTPIGVPESSIRFGMAGPTEPPTLESDGAAAKPRRVAIGRKRRALGATLLGLGTIVAVLWLASGWWSGGYVGARWGAGLQKGYGGVYWLDGTMPEDLLPLFVRLL